MKRIIAQMSEILSYFSDRASIFVSSHVYWMKKLVMGLDMHVSSSAFGTPASTSEVKRSGSLKLIVHVSLCLQFSSKKPLKYSVSI